MPTVIFVLGLCGSGKSTRAKELESCGFLNFDELATGRPLHPNVTEWALSAYPELLKAVAEDKDCVVTEIAFYQPSLQELAAEHLRAACPDVTIRWECFDVADSETADFNCQSDPTRTAEGIQANLGQNKTTIELLGRGVYKLPLDHVLLKTRRRPADVRSRAGADVDAPFSIGDRVKLRATGEVGIVVWVWDDGTIGPDHYVAFFGQQYPRGRPERAPYVLRYGAASLEHAER